jgi:hypothetical protein
MPNDNAPLHGFSIATLLLLTVVVAIGAAAMRTLVITSDLADEQLQKGLQSVSPARAVQLAVQARNEGVLRGIAGGIIGLLVGIYLGATRRRPILGVLLGIVVGGFTGAFAGAVFTEPKNLLVAVVGSALLILLGVVVRGLSRRPHEP